MRVVASWSGGKDAALAVHRARQAGHVVVGLVSVVDPSDRRVRAHGTPAAALRAQAGAAGLRLALREAGWEGYEEAFRDGAATLRHGEDVEGLVFGDVDLEEHREWGERVASDLGLEALYPLWGWNRGRVVEAACEAGIEARVVAVRDPLGEELLGEHLSPALARKVEAAGASPSGEDGAYHTFVTDAPNWDRSLDLTLGAVSQEEEEGGYRIVEHHTG